MANTTCIEVPENWTDFLFLLKQNEVMPIVQNLKNSDGTAYVIPNGSVFTLMIGKLAGQEVPDFSITGSYVEGGSAVTYNLTQENLAQTGKSFATIEMNISASYIQKLNGIIQVDRAYSQGD